MTSLALAKESAKILDNKKAVDIKVIGIRDISILADYFVIATGTSSTHVKALADEVEFQLKKLDVSPNHIEGHNSNSWILLDYGTVIVHIFFGETRDFYDLERLWKDGEQLELSELLKD
jgi:ribosome-associated protein